MTKWRGKPWPSLGVQHLFRQLAVPQRSYTAETVRRIAENNPIVLRDACQCARCVDISTHQRDFNYADIPADISPSSMEETEEGVWQVTWKNDITGYDGHVSVYPKSTLKQLLRGVPPGMGGRRQLSVWDKKSFSAETSDISYEALLGHDSVLAQSLDLIHRHGLIFVVDIPDDESAVMKMVTRLTGLYRNTFYGQSWDVRSVPQAKNVAYTSKYLGFHMDLLYMKEPPGLQLLHCLQNTCQGGESQFVDTFKAVDIIKEKNPRSFDLLSGHNIRYGYRNDGHSYADTKPVIRMAHKGRMYCPRPLITGVNDKNKGIISRLENVFWSPPFIDTIGTGGSKQDTEEFLVASKEFAAILEQPELIFETKLPAGTCAVFDNLRVVHARKAFDINSGSRWLKGIYGDRQDLISNTFRYVWNKEPDVEV